MSIYSPLEKPNNMVSSWVPLSDAAQRPMNFDVVNAFRGYVAKDGVKAYSTSSLDNSRIAASKYSAEEGFFRYLGGNPSLKQFIRPFSLIRTRATNDKIVNAITFITNPSEMTSSTNFSSDSNMTRGGHVVTLNGRNQETISIRGTAPAYYGPEGLSSETMLLDGKTYTGESSSAGFLHIKMLQEMLRKDGGIGLDLYDSLGNIRTSYMYDDLGDALRNRTVLFTLDNFAIDYDGVRYNGSFTSFSIDDDAASPYLIKYNMEFVVSSIGKVGFSGHSDADPKRRDIVTVDQDSITDKYSFSSIGLKPSVAVPEYMKTKFENLKKLDPTKAYDLEKEPPVNDKVLDLSAPMQFVIVRFLDELKEKGYTFKVMETLRDMTRQYWLYTHKKKDGSIYTETLYGNHVSGNAFDLFVKGSGKNGYADESVYRKIHTEIWEPLVKKLAKENTLLNGFFPKSVIPGDSGHFGMSSKSSDTALYKIVNDFKKTIQK